MIDYKTFNIYKPSETFVWTRERIFGVLIFLPLLTLVFITWILQIPDNKVPDWFSPIISIPILTAFIGGAINIWFREELKGKIEGKLIFEKEKITIDNEVFWIKDLKYIEITQNNYAGKYIFRNGFDGMFSQGCKNELRIRLKKNQEKRCLFQILQKRELLQTSDLLNYYIEKGLLTKEARNATLNYI